MNSPASTGAESSPTTHFGVVGVFGRANAGKSTLMNRLVGEKVSIISKRPQTTRRRTLGVITKGSQQVLFCDTPGLHPRRNRLDDFMTSEIQQALEGIDAAMYVIDSAFPVPAEDAEYLKQMFTNYRGPLLLVLNKCDLTEPRLLEELKGTYAAFCPEARVFSISAEKGERTTELLDHLLTLIPKGPHMYAADDFTGQSEREIVAEIIREQVLELYHQEVPHGVNISIEEFTERENGKTFIRAVIHVEREGHKKILIGTRGEGIRNLGIAARGQLNQLLGRDMYLELWVKICPNWRKDEVWVRRFGYQLPPSGKR